MDPRFCLSRDELQQIQVCFAISTPFFLLGFSADIWHSQPHKDSQLEYDKIVLLLYLHSFFGIFK